MEVALPVNALAGGAIGAIAGLVMTLREKKAGPRRMAAYACPGPASHPV
jgi:hypothetical protein